MVRDNGPRKLDGDNGTESCRLRIERKGSSCHDDSLKIKVTSCDLENQRPLKKILKLYLACYTETEISNKIGLSQPEIHKIITNFKNEESNIIPDSLQIFNIWEFSICDSRYGKGI